MGWRTDAKENAFHGSDKLDTRHRIIMTQHCSICGQSDEAVLIAPGSVVSLCQQCLGLIASHMLARTQHNVERPAGWSQGKHWYCCCCGKSNEEVRLLVDLNDSKHNCICNECVIDGIVYLLPSLPKPGTLLKIQLTDMHIA